MSSEHSHARISQKGARPLLLSIYNPLVWIEMLLKVWGFRTGYAVMQFPTAFGIIGDGRSKSGVKAVNRCKNRATGKYYGTSAGIFTGWLFIMMTADWRNIHGPVRKVLRNPFLIGNLRGTFIRFPAKKKAFPQKSLFNNQDGTHQVIMYGGFYGFLFSLLRFGLFLKHLRPALLIATSFNPSGQKTAGNLAMASEYSLGLDVSTLYLRTRKNEKAKGSTNIYAIVTVEVTDPDGKSIPESHLQQKRVGFGARGIKERLKKLGIRIVS